uniref:C2H2-type domain-containing protein n=1 Tax=Neogobius melanostomus TaxID=47308 RepID=A0A8C6UHW2_9GOBI
MKEMIMADGPRCKRRKQANPKRSSVTNFNNGPEASSDSDDEDKLHIVEEESQEEKSHKKNKPVLAHNGDCNGGTSHNSVRWSRSGRYDDIRPSYDLQSTPDDTPALHMCPYCSRGYKRNASLKEHIKYRHETSDDNYSCSHCSYTFTYRSQLERHMSHHRGSKEQRGQGSATRKFKCNVCTKAFKYKHHLKEHLRIHSGQCPPTVTHFVNINRVCRGCTCRYRSNEWNLPQA